MDEIAGLMDFSGLALDSGREGAKSGMRDGNWARPHQSASSIERTKGRELRTVEFGVSGPFEKDIRQNTQSVPPSLDGAFSRETIAKRQQHKPAVVRPKPSAGERGLAGSDSITKFMDTQPKGWTLQRPQASKSPTTKSPNVPTFSGGLKPASPRPTSHQKSPHVPPINFPPGLRTGDGPPNLRNGDSIDTLMSSERKNSGESDSGGGDSGRRAPGQLFRRPSTYKSSTTHSSGAMLTTTAATTTGIMRPNAPRNIGSDRRLRTKTFGKGLEQDSPRSPRQGSGPNMARAFESLTSPHKPFDDESNRWTLFSRANPRATEESGVG